MEVSLRRLVRAMQLDTIVLQYARDYGLGFGVRALPRMPAMGMMLFVGGDGH